MEMRNIESFSHMVVRHRPVAHATLMGNDSFPDIRGTVWFFAADQGTLVVAVVFNLPVGKDYGPFYAFHLHEGAACGSGTGDDPFPDSKGHFNPTGQPHPMHAGDFPSLLGNGGYAYMSFYTGRIKPEDAVNHTVIVHQHAEDFMTQPSGNAGKKLACGPVTIVPMPR